MDINKHNFVSVLPQMLKAIAEGDLVSIDIEMSGIGDVERRGGRKPTLQENYDKIREAAKLYTILQIGLTIFKADETRGVYVASGVHNITIDPLVTEANRVGIERNVTLSSAAIHFLQGHGFDVHACITSGVTYLSRPEVAKALTDYGQRLDNLSNSTAQFVAAIAPHDHDTIVFVRGAKNKIQKWIAEVAAGKTSERSVDIEIAHGTQARYHRKLTHDMLRTQFAGYRGYQPSSEATFMTIEKVNQEREVKIAAGRKGVFECALKNETGFRYIIEALTAAGDISSIPTNMFIVAHDGSTSAWFDAGQTERDLTDIKEKLKSKPRLIIGHNLFMDLAFIYQTFIGELPASVTDFQSSIHALFPQVIDTKYIATSTSHAGFQDSSSLPELHNKYKSSLLPIIEIPEQFNGYANKTKLHEAGYDSFICAQAFVRMVSQMQTLDGSKPAGLPLLLDITHPWYEQYVNKLRVFRTEEGFCDLAPVTQLVAMQQVSGGGAPGTPLGPASIQVAMKQSFTGGAGAPETPVAPHRRFTGPSQGARNQTPSPAQFPLGGRVQ